MCRSVLLAAHESSWSEVGLAVGWREEGIGGVERELVELAQDPALQCEAGERRLVLQVEYLMLSHGFGSFSWAWT